jgi:hypothetical protein
MEETMEGTMGRPEKHDVDYFPFFAKRGKTLNILQSKYGLEGIGFFTNLMRFLALTPDHHYCIKDETDRMNFFAEIGIQDESRGLDMIELMVKTEKLDKGLWEDHKVIVSEAFLESLNPAYEKRNNKVITIDEIRNNYINDKKTDNSMTVREVAAIIGCSHDTVRNYIRKLWPDLMQDGVTTCLTKAQITVIDESIKKTTAENPADESTNSQEQFVGNLRIEEAESWVSTPGNLQKEAETYEKEAASEVSGVNNPQSKVKKSKVKKSKVNLEAAPPAFSENPLPSKPEKTKKAPLREREPANDMERVEKAYLLNWDVLYSQGRVETPDPIVNWSQTRKLLQTHFEKLKPEQIIGAINEGLKDDWVMSKGYYLGVMLSAAVLNRLVNVSGKQSGTGFRPHRIASDNISPDDLDQYFS